MCLLPSLLPLAPCRPPSALESLTNECQSAGLWHFYCRHLPWQTQGFSQHESCKWTAAKVTPVPSTAKTPPSFPPQRFKSLFINTRRSFPLFALYFDFCPELLLFNCIVHFIYSMTLFLSVHNLKVKVMQDTFTELWGKSSQIGWR